ncbi:MAG: arginine--tRNA ligase [Candidatus Diapherotrites archaeon]
MDFKLELAKALHARVKDLTVEEIELLIEIPPSRELGDYVFPCFKLAEIFKKSPAQIALDLSAMKLPSDFRSVQASGPYLNFFVLQESLAQSALPVILKQKGKYGKGSELKGQKVMVEFCSPNSNKPLHVGHLRNLALGESYSRLLETLGAKVVRANLVNDRGVHICKSMLACQKWFKGRMPKNAKGDHVVGDYYVEFSKRAAENPELEAEAQKMLQEWEKGNPKVRKLWKELCDSCLKGFKQTFKELEIEFDKYYFESDYYKKGKEIVQEGFRKGLFKKLEDGAIAAELEAHGLPDKVLIRADGTSIYMTQDLYLAVQKFKDFKLDESAYVVGSEQILHFKQLFKILELLGYKWASKLFHLSYGMVFLPEGRMKSREGTVVDADDLLKEVRSLAREELVKRYSSLSSKELERRERAIALGALNFFLLRVDAKQDMTFNPKESISFEGETGPYLQYSYARAKSILRKSKGKGKPKWEALQHEKEQALLALLATYPQILLDCRKSLSLHKLCNFLLELASAFNSFYHEVPVLKASTEQRAARLALVQATAQVLENGLTVLHVPVLEQM